MSNMTPEEINSLVAPNSEFNAWLEEQRTKLSSFNDYKARNDSNYAACPDGRTRKFYPYASTEFDYELVLRIKYGRVRVNTYTVTGWRKKDSGRFIPEYGNDLVIASLSEPNRYAWIRTQRTMNQVTMLGHEIRKGMRDRGDVDPPDTDYLPVDF